MLETFKRGFGYVLGFGVGLIVTNELLSAYNIVIEARKKGTDNKTDSKESEEA